MFLYNAPGVQEKLIQFAQQAQTPEQAALATDLAKESVAVIGNSLPDIAGKMLMDINTDMARYVFNPDTGRVESSHALSCSKVSSSYVTGRSYALKT